MSQNILSDSNISFPVYGNDVTGEAGQIASPLYPRTYPFNAHYQWTITVDGDSIVEIRFLDIDIEDLYDCYYDHLKVRALGLWDCIDLIKVQYCRDFKLQYTVMYCIYILNVFHRVY